MRVFESLNCVSCKEPFARVANQPRSPRRLMCGLAMCHECFMQEKALAKEQRKHQCGYSFGNCFSNENFAYFLIDVLSQQDSLVLLQFGYVLQKPFKVPECSICHEEFSMKILNKKSFALQCNHIICAECYLKTRKANVAWVYEMTCPLCCQQETYCDIFVTKLKDRFQDFLDELPQITRQLEAMKSSCGCDECKDEDLLDKMLYCGLCSKTICGICGYKKHRLHHAIPLLEKKASEMEEKLRKETANVINTYKNIFPELYNGLLGDIDSFEKKLLSKEATLKEVLTFANLQKKHKSFTKLKTDFEVSADELVPHLRRFSTKVKKLMKTLDEDDSNIEC